MFGFLEAYTASKAHRGGDAIIQALAGFDPEGASDAQLSLMESNLDALGKHVAKAHADFDAARKVFGDAQATNSHRLEAAQLLSSQLEAADDAKKPELKASLDKLLSLTEAAQAELAQTKADMAEAESFYRDLQGAYDEAAGRLKGARTALTQAMHDQERAKLKEQAAEARASVVADVSHLHPAGDQLNAALTAMRGNTERARQHAEALELKTHALAPDHPDHDDPNIKAALDAASGVTPPASQSFSDRLASLQQAAAR